VFSPEDTQVDNRKLAAGLRVAAEAAGAIIREHQPVKTISSSAGRVDGIVLADGTKVAADVVVLAAGAWSRTIEGLATEFRPPVRPIKGQMLALRMDPAAPLLTHVVWAPGAYLVPRLDGRLLVGATVEEKGYDTSLTAGGILTLLEAAWRVVDPILNYRGPLGEYECGTWPTAAEAMAAGVTGWHKTHVETNQP